MTGAAEPELRAVAERVAKACGVPLEAMRQRRRGSRRAALARQIAMYLASVDLELPRRAVAASFRRDRTTVIHSIHVVEERRDDPEFDRWLAAMEGGGAP